MTVPDNPDQNAIKYAPAWVPDNYRWFTDDLRDWARETFHYPLVPIPAERYRKRNRMGDS